MKELAVNDSLSLQETSSPLADWQGEVDVQVMRPLLIGLFVIVIGLGSFLFWGVIAPLDAGVVANATVTIANNRKTVQHLNGGTVSDIYVKEGDLVERGQPLLQLDKTQVLARQNALEAQYLVAKTIEDRLLAERDGLPEVQFDPKTIARFKDNPRLADAINLQQKVFAARRNANAGEASILQETLQGALAQSSGLSQVQYSRKRQLMLIERELDAIRRLSKNNYYPKMQLLTLERESADISGKLAEDIVNIGRIYSQINEIKLQLLQRANEFKRDVVTELTAQQKEVATLEDELDSADYDVDHTTIRAPIGGVVLGLHVTTVGGVIQAGGALLDVVPGDQPLQVDAMIPVQSIDKMESGLPVSISFPAFNHAQTPIIPGKVITISADRMIDEASHQPYYLAQIGVTDAGMKLLGTHQIKAGMPASITIKTGERTLLSYLLKPLLERFDKSFKEQ
ncbi:HlyD family type I secretion periplasmic adaptor subunit [Aeromonas eucrenophila]|uniref:Membrane fusion protein (MFP) family protein n=1 Tax=Aeromonas eucrenophila TaxID=649 RepID=A0ABW0YES3_9GAMM|nr:HlyD family type I secretion periplasmic adaptor subunit [Aeromonas eucrenophila]